MTTTSTKPVEIKVERIIPAPPSEVFDAWLDPKVPGTLCHENAKLIVNPKVANKLIPGGEAATLQLLPEHAADRTASNADQVFRRRGCLESVKAGASYPIFGTPDQVVRELNRIRLAGFDGLAIGFHSPLDELPYFVQEVLPRMQRLGLRQAIDR